MPHKNNPDVFEIMRGKCNKLQAVPFELASIMGNLTSGYFRDLQLLKEKYIYTFEEIIGCLEMCLLAIPKIKVNPNIIGEDEKYDYLFSVEEVNRRVNEGIPFREAYKQVGIEIESGNFTPNREVKHVHEGSIGNLCTAEIEKKMAVNFAKINSSEVEKAESDLIK